MPAPRSLLLLLAVMGCASSPQTLPPTVSILAPLADARIDDGSPLTFSATIDDDGPSGLSVSWWSDRDGEFSTVGPDPTGTAQFTDDARSVGLHLLTVTATDGEGQIGEDTVSFTVNDLPSAPGITVGPDPAGTSDDLVVQIDAASTDLDGDAITYTFAWSVDGEAVTDLSTDTVPSDRTTRGEVWEVTVAPADPYGEGDPAQASLTIANTAPVVTATGPDPATPGTTDVLIVTAEGIDVDGDVVSLAYTWSVDGAPVPEVDGPSLDGALHFDKADLVTVEIIATDDIDAGPAWISAPLEVQNTPPDAPDLTIVPPTPQPTDDLVCTIAVEADDADDDPITYDFGWTVDGVAFAGTSGTTHRPGDTIPSSNTDVGQRWACTATPHDGEAHGTAATTEVTGCDGYALTFDGVRDCATVPYDPVFPVEVFTLTAWIQCDLTGLDQYIVVQSEDPVTDAASWAMFVGPGGFLNAGIETTSGLPALFSSGEFVCDGLWHHAAVTRDASADLFLYVDGVQAAAFAGTGTPSSASQETINVGCMDANPAGHSWFFDGTIDAVSVWDVALPEIDITGIYAQGIVETTPGLVALWRFDEIQGQDVLDASPSGLHGYLGTTLNAEPRDPARTAFCPDP